jgi:hypothetical protein
LPQHPLPGERGFTGVPPPGETRFVSNEMVFHVAPNISRQAVENVARKLNLTMVGSHNVALTGGTMFHFRVANGRSVADAVRGLEAEKLGVAQPNYVFKLQQDPKLAARTQGGEPTNMSNKLHLGGVYRVATGAMLVAVIDSEIDRASGLAGAFVGDTTRSLSHKPRAELEWPAPSRRIASSWALLRARRFWRSMPSARMRANPHRRPPSTFSPDWNGRSAGARGSST